MGSRSQVVPPPPPPGFVLQTILPPPPPGFVLSPPPGFVLEGQAEPTKPPEPTATPWRPLGPVGRARALAPTPEEAPALEEAGRAFLKAAEQPISATLGGESFSSLVDKTLGEWGRTGGWRGSVTDATRIAAGVADFIQSPAGVAALAATVATGGAAGPYIAAGFGAHAAVQTPQAIRTYLEDPTPENLQQALLTPGFAALMGSAAGHVRGPAAPERVAGVRAPVERAPEAKPAPPARPLPPPAPVSAREAADLGVSAERVPEVLRRQREAEAVTARAAERQPQRPSPILEEPPPPPKGFVLERPSELQRLEKAGVFEKRTAVDEFGDVIEKGGRIVDSLGRSGRVLAVNEKTVRVDFGRGRPPEPVPLTDVTVKRHGRPKALEGIGRKPVRLFGDTEIAFHERLLRGPEIPEGGLHANPVFSLKFWEKADAAIRPFTEKIDMAIVRAVGKLPVSIRKWLREDPRTKQIIQEARREVGQRQNETEGVLRMVLRENPTPEELAMADRLARGVPEDLTRAKPEIRPVLEKAAQEVQGLAQQMTSERAALGLPIREEWVEGPKRWYPNLWRQHLGSPRMIVGRLFAKLTPKKAEMGSLKRRTTDRYTVVDKSGNIARGKAGQQAIFTTKPEADAFVREHPHRALRVLEPMTHQQAVAHGLIEDLAVNVRHGFGKGWSLVAKTRALATIGRELVSDSPQPGYVNLGERGFTIPAELAKRNRHIARLRDGYVPEEVASTLTAYYGPRGAFSTFFRVLEGNLRKWVTIRNPFRHPKQIIENELTLAFGDSAAALNVPARVRAFRDFARGARGEQNIPYWDEYTASNLWYSDIVRGEFETVWKGLDSVKAGSAPLSLRERMAIWAEENSVARELMAADRFAEKLYRAEDQVYKFYFYRTLRERGLSPQEAEYRTSRTFFDYSDVPPIVRAANRIIPFAPNVTYQFSRIIGTALRDRPASTTMKLALLIHGYAFVREEMMRAAGITEQDEKNMGKLAPRWDELVLPMTDSKGRNIKISILWLAPYGELMMLQDIFAAGDPERGSAALAHKLVPMAAQPIVTIATSRKSFGQKFLTGTETPAEAHKKRAAEFLKGYLPGLLGQYWERLYKNATAGPERKKPLWEKALVEPITGRVEHFRPEEKIGLSKALRAGKTRELMAETSRQRGRVIRGQAQPETLEEVAERTYGRLAEEDVSHPGTFAVVQALEDRRIGAARTAFKELIQSGYYSTEEDALKAVNTLRKQRQRLTKLSRAPLGAARNAAQAVIDEFRQSGRVDERQFRRFVTKLLALREPERKALIRWVKEQVLASQARTGMQRKRAAEEILGASPRL